MRLKRSINLLIFFFINNILFSQNISGIVRDTENNLLFGVSIYNSSNTKNEISDVNGNFSIKSNNGENKLIISHVGYTSKKINIESSGQPIEIGYIILENNSLDEIVISGTLRELSKLKSVVPIELYSSDFFKSTPKTSFFEAIEAVNGVRSQLNCSVCNTGDIHINGQDGANTMVLIDGLPLVSGLSSVYGLSGIPQSLIKQIEIIKGPASTLYGSEAIGGVINLITKLPENTDSFSLDTFASFWGELNIDLGSRYNLKKSQGIIGINYFNYSNPIDNNGDGFTDLALQHRISIFNKINSKKNSLAFRYFYEDRWGGQMNWDSSFRGGDQVYGESIYTSRFEVFGKYNLSKKIFLQYSLNSHDQNSVYGITSYKASQTIGFIQAVYSKKIQNHNLLFGATYRHTIYDDNTPATEEIEKTFLPGLFIQDQLTLSKFQTLLFGIRYDNNSIYGDIFTPRINYKLSNKDESSIIRIGFGTGYRVVNVFTEDHAALTGARDVIFVEDILPEKSWNLSFNWNKKIYTKYGTIFDMDFSLFNTIFSNKIIPDYDINPNQIIYSNLDGKGVTQGASINLNSLFANGLKIVMGATFIDSKVTSNNTNKYPYLTEKFSANYKISYTIFKPEIAVDLSGNIIGPMKLPLLGDLDTRDPYSPLVNIINLQTSYKFKEIEIYAGIKNILDFKPPSNSIARAFDPFDSNVEFGANGQIIATPNNPNALSFDPSYVYYSNQGITGFIGIRYNF